jgi:hypothetical protein
MTLLPGVTPGGTENAMPQERIFPRQSQFVDSPAAGWCAARAPLRIGMERLLVVDGDFFAGVDVSQSKEQDMAVQSSHEGIWLARVIDVVRAVAAPRAVQTEAPIDVADTQNLTMACAPASFKVRNPLAGVLSYLPPAYEMSGGKATLTVNPRLADCEAVREFHRPVLYDRSIARFCVSVVAAVPPDVRKVFDLPDKSIKESGLRPLDEGVAQKARTRRSEGHRPSAHQAAKPRCLTHFIVCGAT